MMDKEELRRLILNRLQADYELLLQAARDSHAAATHEETIPDNKYDTLALEASYIAQGQANRAQQIKEALEAFRRINFVDVAADTPIRLGVLVRLEDDQGLEKRLFIGPAAGGLKLEFESQTITLITPDSPLGKKLLGLQEGEEIELPDGRPCEIVEVI